MTQTKLPPSFKEYFWDVDFDNLNQNKHSYLIIKRLLDRGKTPEIRWLLKAYDKNQIKNVLLKTRDLSRVSGTFWTDVLGLNPSEIPCLQKPYFPIHFGLYS